MNNTEKYSKDQIALFIVINIILLALITYASTSLTVSFFGSMGAGEVKTSNLIMGLVNDSCKIFLPLITGIAIFKKKYFHAAILVFIICGTMYISYLASQGLDLNVSNKQLLDGTGKQDLVDAKTEKVTELNKLEAEKKDLISPIKSQIEALPNDYITKKANMQKDIAVIVSKYAEKIKLVQAKIDEYNSKIQNYKADATLTTQGYHALANFTGIAVGEITKWKNIFMEILAIILSVNLGLLIGESNFNLFNLLKTGYSTFKNRPNKETTIVCEDKIPKDTTKHDPNNSPTPQVINNTSKGDINSRSNVEIGGTSGLEFGKHDFIPYPDDEISNPPAKNKIGFDTDPALPSTDYDNADIEEYIKYMYSGNKSAGDVSPGTDKFRAYTTLSPKKIKGIRYHLEKKEVIKIQLRPKSTIILISKNEALIKARL